MRNTILFAVAAVALVGFGKAVPAAEQAQALADQSSGAGGRQQEQVTIEGRRELERKASRFVSQLTDFGDRTTGMARWREPICPLVSGISRQQGDYVLGRISDIAEAAGAPLGGKKCHANLVILVSAQPQAALADLMKRHRTALFADAPLSRINAWIAAPGPVKAWYNTVAKTPEGMPLLRVAMPVDGSQVRRPDDGCCLAVSALPDTGTAFDSNQWSQASHLLLNGIWTIYRVIEVVDATQLKGASLGQLADYVALSGLAELRQGVDLGDAPTILRLFDKDPKTASPGMTFWDRTFLKSLYSTAQNTVLQRREIAREMVREIPAPR